MACAFVLLPVSLAWSIPAPKGVKIGSKGKFHPRLYFNIGYDQNVFNRSYQSDIRDGSALGETEGAPFLTVRPGLELDIPTDSVNFYLGGYANYTQYFPIAFSLDGMSNITAKADVSATFLPRSAFSFTVFNNFSRSSGDPYTAESVFNQTLFAYNPGTQTGSAFITHSNNAGLVLHIKPGGGTLVFDVGYNFDFNFYPNENLDHHIHRVILNAKWNFFPRTAFTFESEFRVFNFAPRFNLSSEGSNVDAFPLKAYVGIAGQLTNRILLRARVGGGYTFAADRSADGLPNDNWGMVIGNIDFTYQFRLTTFLRIGFAHDFNPAAFSNYYHTTAGYVEFQAQLPPSQRPFVLAARVSGGYQGFGKIPVNINIGGTTGSVRFNSRNINDDNTINRGDWFVRGQVDVDWYAFPFWMLGVTARIAFTNSNTFVVVDNNNQLGFGFTKFEVFFKTELAY